MLPKDEKSQRQDGALTGNGLKQIKASCGKKEANLSGTHRKQDSRSKNEKKKLVLRTKLYTSKCDNESDPSSTTKEKGSINSLQFNPIVLCLSPRNNTFGSHLANYDLSLLSFRKWLEKPLCFHSSDDIGENDSTNAKDTCAICMCSIKDGDKVAVTPCSCVNNHFHSECLKKWLQRKNQCPLCQTPNIASPLHIKQEKYAKICNQDSVKRMNKNVSIMKKVSEYPHNKGTSSQSATIKPKKNDLILAMNTEGKINAEKRKSCIEINRNQSTPVHSSQINSLYKMKNISQEKDEKMNDNYNNTAMLKRVAVPSKDWKKKSYYTPL